MISSFSDRCALMAVLTSFVENNMYILYILHILYTILKLGLVITVFDWEKGARAGTEGGKEELASSGHEVR